MNRFIIILIIFFVIPLIYGCKIVPKSIQYQKDEEKAIGSVDVMNPLVEEAQILFSELGYDTGNTDGRMGQKTRESIKEFQESIGLKSTGYIDKLTWREIEDIRRDIERRDMKEEYMITVRSAYSEKKNSISSGSDLTTRQIQTALRGAGFDPGAIDGRMGPRTQQAVKEFQRTKGLKVDGVVGPKTWAELGKYLE